MSYRNNDDFEADELSPMQRQMSVNGQKGGNSTKKIHGLLHFIQAGRKGGKANKELHATDPNYFKELGRRGMIARKAKAEARKVNEQQTNPKTPS